MYIDTHAHVNFAAFKDDADEVIKRALENQVLIINVGSQYSTSKRAVEITGRYESGVWAAVGIHPIYVGIMNHELGIREKKYREKFNYQKYLDLAKNLKVVAIGEMGLDYHHFEAGDDITELKKKQKEVFLEGIKLANETGKPMIIHCWGVKSRKELDHARTDAYDDLYEILKNDPIEKTGVIHSFVGGYKTARKFIELGYKIGLNGVVTYAEDFNRLIKELDIKDIVLETDCPYLTPVPHKGERNEPIYIKFVAEKIAEVKNVDVEEVAKITTQNARTLFNL